MSFLTVLPLAFVIIAGPQLISAILLATGHDARRNSLAFLAGAALAVTAGTMVAYWVTGLLERVASPSGEGTVKTAIDWLVIALFLFLMVRTYLRRKTAEEPRWMGRRPHHLGPLQLARADRDHDGPQCLGGSSGHGSTSARLASRQRPAPERLAGWSS